MRSIVGCLHACIKTKGSQFARLISWISKYKFIERKNKRNLGIHGEFTPFIGIYISHVKRFAVKIKNGGKKNIANEILSIKCSISWFLSIRSAKDISEINQQTFPRNLIPFMRGRRSCRFKNEWKWSSLCVIQIIGVRIGGIRII